MSVFQLMRKGWNNERQRFKAQAWKWHTSLSLPFQWQKLATFGQSHGHTKGQYSKCLTSGSPDTDQSGHRSAIEWECSGSSLLYQMLALCLQDYEKWRQGRSLRGFEVTWCGSILITIGTTVLNHTDYQR